MSRSGMDTPYVKNLALRSIEAGVLRVAYQDLGPSGGAGCDFVAMGYDLLMLMDALAISSAVLAGYDWGGRADFLAVVSHSCRRRPPPLLSTRCCA